MSCLKNVIVAVRSTPGKAWIAATIIPGGLIAMGAWITVIAVYRAAKKQYEKVKGRS